MKKSDIFIAIKSAVDNAKKGDRTVTIQLEIIRYYKHLIGVDGKEFAEQVGLKPSLTTLFTDSMKLAGRLHAVNFNIDKI
ncbi:HTH-like domain-containing protein [Serratia fonticola]|uniref:HTH-like domain-containing protein n=1 Tax=Serratia fonticola TaxID=47917 RepID=UPI0021BB4CE4|nr:hypothetical protein [Serratia fonticola]